MSVKSGCEVSSDPPFLPVEQTGIGQQVVVMTLVVTALLRDTAEPVARASSSPLIGPLFRGIVGSNHFRLRDDAVFILRESVAICK